MHPFRCKLVPSRPPAVLLAGVLACCALGIKMPAQTPAGSTPETAGAPLSKTPGPGVPFTAEQISSLIPATVYFQGKSAPVQLRNAGGTTFAGGAVVWVALVDSSGYSSSVQEKYQFYFVTETPLTVGGVSVPAGVYGGGFLKDHFLLMDVGGHTVAQGPLQMDADLHRPRPLEVLADTPSSVKLYLGRRWVKLQSP